MLANITIFCLLYLAAVARLMGGDSPWTVDVAAVAVVCAVRWCSPSLAACWVFGLGCLLDGVGGGPFGLQAAALVVWAALLPHCGFSAAANSGWRWMWAIGLTTAWNAGVAAGVDWVSGSFPMATPMLIHHVASAAVTAIVVGCWIGGWRQLTGNPCTTH